MTEEFEDMIEEVEDEVVEESQSSADPINTEEVVEEDELIVTDEMLDTIADCYRGTPGYSPVFQCRRSDY